MIALVGGLGVTELMIILVMLGIPAAVVVGLVVWLVRRAR